MMENEFIVVDDGTPKLTRKEQIDIDLATIDTKKVRAITDALLDGDTTLLAELEAQADALRAERKSL